MYICTKKLIRFESRVTEDYNNYHLNGKIVLNIKEISFRGRIQSGDNHYSFQYSEKDKTKIRINTNNEQLQQELESLINRTVTQVKNIANYPFTE